MPAAGPKGLSQYRQAKDGFAEKGSEVKDDLPTEQFACPHARPADPARARLLSLFQPVHKLLNKIE
jgi:hypothetical protein